MLWESLFWVALIASLGIGFLYFRDLGDVIQMIVKVKRENMIRFIRNEYRLIGTGLVAGLVMAVVHLAADAGPSWVFWIALGLIALFYGFPWVWVHVGLRNQQNSARFYSIEEARSAIAPTSSVVVIENNGVARAHPDGKPIDLEVLAQHGNNLILRDNGTGEPIQHIYGRREGESRGMTPWPTFRMTFRGFQKAYPEGTVFLNKPSKNPLLRLFDMAADIAFSWGISRQHTEAEPIMNNMTREDPRLPKKTYVWGVTIDDDATCWTDDFIVEQDGLINATVGGRDLVVYADPKYESIGVWYNDGGAPVTRMDFFGDSDQGQLERVETLRSGVFWLVWAEFFPETDINRVGSGETAAA